MTAVTAYDMMGRLDKKISWVDTSKATAPTFPCKMQAMLKYICDRCGFTTDFTCENITVEKAPDGYTARELISYIAASHGANARFSPSEVLKLINYTQVEKTVQHGRCYSLDIGEDYTVKGLLFSKDSSTKIYIDGTSKEYDEDADGVVEIYDPLATVAISEYAWNKLGGLSYSAVSLEMPAENILEPGDVFTVQDADGTEKTAIVMEQQLTVSCTGGFIEKISCDAESKKQTRNSENRAEATEKQAASNAISALTSYQYLADDSVKCNGVTYTVEKDAETGLISKISDSNGNSLNPEIPSRITDVALHNAVFWAVAMARGLGSPDPAEELIKTAIYRLYEPDGTIYMTNYVDTGIPQSRLTSSEAGVTVAFVLKPSAWAPYYGLWGQHSGNDGQNIQCTKSSGGNSAHLYRHNIGFDLTAGEKYVLIISDQQNTADCYVMKNTVEITEGTPSESTSSAFGNVVLYNSYQFEEQRNYHGIAYDALIWDKALTRSEALAVAKRLMAQHNITGGNT